MTKTPRLPIFMRPDRADVDRAIAHPEEWASDPTARIPTQDPAEWDKDHHAFYIYRVLPILDLPLDLRQLAAEAYLTPGFEQYSDGSTLVPNDHRYGHTKDWEGCMHDYLFYLHHLGAADAYGRTWGYWASNNMYRRAWACSGEVVRSVVWYTGLTVGSWLFWCGWL